MATVVMKNRVTTEYRNVEKDSPEFWKLRAELHADGKPRWEQTGQHDLAAFEDRVESGQLRDTDLGDAAGPTQLSTEGEGYTPGLDRGVPTPGELEQGAGRAAEFSEEEREQLMGGLHSATSGADSGEGYPGGPPTTPEGASEEERIAAGVSDTPVTEGDGAGSAPKGEYDDLTKEQLQEKVDARGIPVERADGKEGDPLVSDYITALEGDDAFSGSQEPS